MAKNKEDALNLVSGGRSPLMVVWRLSWPVFLEQVLTTLVGYADTAMVGSLGPAATASTSISNPIVFLVNGVIMALGVGVTALISRSIGARDYRQAKVLIRHSLLILLCLGLPIGIVVGLLSRVIPQLMGAGPDILDLAARYNLIVAFGRPFQIASMLFCSVYRGCGDTKTPLMINTGVNVLNVIGNYFLIFPTRPVALMGMTVTMPGAGWGVAGAAASTAFSMFVGGLAAVLPLFAKNNVLRITPRDDFRPNFPLLRQIFRISLPAMLERVCMSGAQIIITSSVASLGTIVIAANTVYLTAESIAYMPGFAFATAATTLVGQALGAKRVDLAKKYNYVALYASFAVMALAGLGLYVFAVPLVSIFSQDAQVIALAAQCLRIVAFLEPPQTGAMVLGGSMRGAGDTFWPFLFTAIGMWGVRALGAVLCIRFWGMGLPGACVCMLIESFLRCLLMWLRFATGKWVHAIKDLPPEPEEKTAARA